MALAKVEPFCSSATRSLLGVLESKNFSQLALIWAWAPVLLPVLAPLGLAEGVAAAEVAGADVAGALDDDELLLEQAVAARIAAMAPAVAKLLAGWNSMCYAS
jgi:hypothetical protein